MRASTISFRSLFYYWRINLAVIAGVATAAAVLSGALLVGESVRGSLRDLALSRLGATDSAIASAGFFRAELAGDLAGNAGFGEAFRAACPLIALEGVASGGESGQRANGVLVYGIDDRFWAFHGQSGVQSPGRGEALVSPALARELALEAEGSLLVRLESHSEIPRESLHGHKENIGQAIRVRVREILEPARLGEFSLMPQQGEVRAVFLALDRLQRDLKAPGQANTILVAGDGPAERLGELLRSAWRLEDVGLKLRPLDAARGIALESRAALLPDAVVERASETGRALGFTEARLFTYLANSIRARGREIPYSLATAVDEASFRALGGDRAAAAPVILNDWAARDLGASPGDTVTLDYYLWTDSGALETRRADFTLAAIAPLRGPAADRDVSPEYPGLTDTDSLSDWDPPFPIDLSRIRDRDERYWDDYRTTPKIWLRLEDGQRLWRSRWGGLTSIRFRPEQGADLAESAARLEAALRENLDPRDAGVWVTNVREQNLEGSRGAIDFGEYFVYFSYFLMVSALILTVLFFRLGVEQRLSEIGLLRAVGFTPAGVRAGFVREGAVLAAIGSVVGVAGGVAYAALILYGLKTWWVGAVGTTLLELHVAPGPLLAGALAGVAMALTTIVWTLRGLRTQSPRGLLAGTLEAGPSKRPGRRRGLAAMLAAAAALALLGLGLAQLIPQEGAFFGAGALLLVAALTGVGLWLGRGGGGPIEGRGGRDLVRLGFRNATWRPGRSVLSVALIATATFLLVALDAFRREGPPPESRQSGTGGYPLLAESQTPFYQDLNGYARTEIAERHPEEADLLRQASFTPFRLRPGEDVSCLNLYQPRNPRILAPPPAFLSEGRFAFAASLAETAEERANPWVLLERTFPDGAVPAIADANSLTYVLHRKLGEDFVIERPGQEPIRLRFVASLADSIFQSEILISERNFVRLFPEQQGYRVFLIDGPHDQAERLAGVLERDLEDHGFDATGTGERLAAFHRVESTYLSTFQALGALGLLLGTVGLAAVLLRNTLERRRELALLRAIGYQPADLATSIVAENTLLLLLGLGIGVATALLAIAPAVAARGAALAILSPALLVALVFATGLTASLAAVRAAIRTPVLESLRSG